MNTTDFSEGSRFDWELNFFIIRCVITVMTIYMTGCHIAVLWLKRGKLSEQNKSFCRRRGRNYPFAMGIFMIVSGTLGVVNLIQWHVSYFTSMSPAIFSTISATYLAAFASLYYVLWLRQASFHSDPAMRHLTNRGLKMFSYFQACFLALSLICFIVANAQQAIQRGCTYPSCLPRGLYGTTIAVQFEAQIALLILFVCPMLRHRKIMKSGVGSGDHGYIRSVVQRATVVAAISICIDVVCAVIFLIARRKFDVIFNLMLVLNQICITFCFVDWREKFMPWHFRSMNENAQVQKYAWRDTDVPQIWA